MARNAKLPVKKRRRTPFLKSKALFWLLLIIFFPLALFILWRYKPYGMAGRCIITLLFSFVLFSLPFGYHYYSEYEVLAAEKAAQEAIINSDPLYGYRSENLTLDQASFLKYYDVMTDELENYLGIDTSVNQLLTIVKENQNVNIGVMLAHLTSYEDRLENSIAEVKALDLSTFSEEQRNYFTKEKETYINILNDINFAYKMLETAIGKDDVNSYNGAAAIMAAKNKELADFRNNLKIDAVRLKVSPTTKKSLYNVQQSLESSDINILTTRPDDRGPSISPVGVIDIQPPMPHSEALDEMSGTFGDATLSLDESNSTLLIDIGGTKIEGDVVSVY